MQETSLNLKFFGEDNPAIPKRVCMHILSLLSIADRKTCREVSKLWKTTVDETKQGLVLLHKLKLIPKQADFDFPSATLAQLTISPMSGGMTNCSFLVQNYWGGKVRDQVIEPLNKWVLRIPGVGSSVFITRKDEKHNAEQASKLKLNVQIDFFDADTGLQLTRYLDKSKPINKDLLGNETILPSVGKLLKTLHDSDLFVNAIPVFSRNQRLYMALKAKPNSLLPKDIDDVAKSMTNLETLIERFSFELKPCHNDTTPANFLWSEEDNKTFMIDYEYSGNNDCIWDLVYFAMEAGLSKEQELVLIKSYFGGCNNLISSWFELYKPIVEWWITLWSWTQVASNANACDKQAYIDLAETCYKRTKDCLSSSVFKDAVSSIEKTVEANTSGKTPRNFSVN